MATLAVSLSGLSALARAGAAAPSWKSGYEVAIDFSINDPGEGRYHRPYVAVWIEDADGNAVRSLSLWVQTSGRGPRWIPDLKRWYRKEIARRKASGGDLIDVISSATRMPGKYSLVWNGRNDDGELVPSGTYSVCIEAAREHGTYQLIRQDFNFGSQTFQKDLPGNIEIKEASVEYRKRK
jgi:hypothetical protein